VTVKLTFLSDFDFDLETRRSGQFDQISSFWERDDDFATLRTQRWVDRTELNLESTQPIIGAHNRSFRLSICWSVSRLQNASKRLESKIIEAKFRTFGHFWTSTSFGWGKGGKVTSTGWQVTLCDLIWHVISRSGVVISITNCYIRFTYLLTLYDLWEEW